MGVTNFSNGIASFGVPVLPAFAPSVRTGTVFFVCNRTNANGSNGNSGLSLSQPLATVDAAIRKCTANAGDTIYVMHGHAETVTATSIVHDVAGVTIIGCGHGTNRPVFTFGAAAATITVSAANARWSNCRFVANFADVAAAFTVSGVECHLTDSDFVDTSSILNFLSIVKTSATNNAADGLTFNRAYVYGLAATDGAVISILGNNLRVQAVDNIVDKAATNDAGHFITLSSKIVGGIRLLRNYVTVVGSTGAAVGVFGTGSGSTSSGIIADNYVWSLDTTAGLFFTASTGIRFHANYMSGAVDASGTLMPAADNPA